MTVWLVLISYGGVAPRFRPRRRRGYRLANAIPTAADRRGRHRHLQEQNRADLVAENVALRHQLSCLKHRRKRPKLRPLDRALWAVLSRLWSRWREALVMANPETVVGWHRQGFKLFWTWKSRKRRAGRPRIDKDVRKLIVEMASTNVGWGAPRIHGELLKLGIEVSESTVQRYMPKRKAPPGSQQRLSALTLTTFPPRNGVFPEPFPPSGLSFPRAFPPVSHDLSPPQA